MSNYTEDETLQSKKYRNLPPLYFRARAISEKFFEDQEVDVFQPLAQNVAGLVYGAINDHICEWLLSDTENNLQTAIQQAVEAEISNILTGGECRYIDGDAARHVRESIFQKYGDQLRNDRIKDLEERVERLRQVTYYL